MTKEELEQLKSTVKQWLFHTGSLDPTNYANELKLKFIEPREKRIAELEEKISNLLSCKKCPENKGGFICQKEYEDKCLAQKIQFIKELQQGNAELKKTYRKQRNKRIDELQKANAELKARLKAINLLTPELEKASNLRKQQLTKAKEIISEYISILKGDTKNWKKTQEKAEQFLSEVEK